MTLFNSNILKQINNPDSSPGIVDTFETDSKPKPTSNNSGSFMDELIADIFGESPELAFLGHLKEKNLSGSLENFFINNTNTFLDQFKARQAQQLAQGGLPTLEPGKFFKDFDFRQAAGKFSPQRRGLGTGNLIGSRTNFGF